MINFLSYKISPMLILPLDLKWHKAYLLQSLLLTAVIAYEELYFNKKLILNTET